MKRSELKQLIREVITESDFFSDMDAANDWSRKQKAAKKELHYSIKKEIKGKNLNITLVSEFENPKQAAEMASVVERAIEDEIDRLIKGYNLNMKRL